MGPQYGHAVHPAVVLCLTPAAGTSPQTDRPIIKMPRYPSTVQTAWGLIQPRSITVRDLPLGLKVASWCPGCAYDRQYPFLCDIGLSLCIPLERERGGATTSNIEPALSVRRQGAS